jgi:HrpA-like RNA helicase
MSATIDAKLLQKYFNNCPLVHIIGRNFHVEILYTAPGEASPSFVVLAATVVVNILRMMGQATSWYFFLGQMRLNKYPGWFASIPRTLTSPLCTRCSRPAIRGGL